MKTPFLLLLDGMTGSGKTTATSLLANTLPRTAIIGMDRVKRFLSDFERGTKDNTIARNVVFSMTEAYLHHSISVIVDQPIKTQTELAAYENLAETSDIPLYKIQLHTDPNDALERVLSRQEGSKHQLPEDHIRRNISLYKDRSEDGFIVIETTSKSKEEVAENILSIIQ